MNYLFQQIKHYTTHSRGKDKVWLENGTFFLLQYNSFVHIYEYML